MNPNTPQDREGSIGVVLGYLEELYAEMMRRNIQPQHFVSALIAFFCQLCIGDSNRADLPHSRED